MIPRLLHWREEVSKLRPLTRNVVTTYAYYILGTNLAFGLLSTLKPEWLLDGSGLADHRHGLKTGTGPGSLHPD
jgi:hypothetical protein